MAATGRARKGLGKTWRLCKMKGFAACRCVDCNKCLKGRWLPYLCSLFRLLSVEDVIDSSRAFLV